MMSQTLTVHVPDETYRSLVDWAQRDGNTPEGLAANCITNVVQARAGDPLLSWAGAFEADVADVAERHDAYVAQSLLAESASPDA